MMATNNNFYNNPVGNKRPNGPFVDANDPSKRPKPGPMTPNGSYNNNTGYNNTMQSNPSGWVNTDAQTQPSTSNRVHMQTMNVKALAPNQKNTLGNKMGYRSPPPNATGPPPQRSVNVVGSTPNPFSVQPQQQMNVPQSMQHNSYQNGFQQPPTNQGQDFFPPQQSFQQQGGNNNPQQQSFQQLNNVNHNGQYGQPPMQNKPVMQPQPQTGFSSAPTNNQINQTPMNAMNQGFQNKTQHMQPTMNHSMPPQQMGANPMQSHQPQAQQHVPHQPIQQSLGHQMGAQQMKPQQHAPPPQPMQGQQKSPVMQHNQMNMPPQGQPLQPNNGTGNYPPNQPPQQQNIQQQPGMQGRPNSAPSAFPPNQSTNAFNSSTSFGAPSTPFNNGPTSNAGPMHGAPQPKTSPSFPSNPPPQQAPLPNPPVNKPPAVPPQPQQGFTSAPVQNTNRPTSAPAAIPPKPIPPPIPARTIPQQNFAPQPSIQAPPVHSMPPQVQRPPTIPPQPLAPLQPNFDDMDDELLSNAYDTFESTASQNQLLKPNPPPVITNHSVIPQPTNKYAPPVILPANPIPVHNTHPAPLVHPTPNPMQHNMHSNPAPLQKAGPTPMNPPVTSAPPAPFKPPVPAPSSTMGLPLPVQQLQPVQPQQTIMAPKQMPPPVPLMNNNSNNNITIPESQGMTDTQATSFLEQQMFQLRHKVEQMEKEEKETKLALKKSEEEKKKLSEQVDQQDTNLRVLREKNSELSNQVVQKNKQIEDLQLKMNHMTQAMKQRDHEQNTDKFTTRITFLEQEKVELQNKVKDLTKETEKLRGDSLKLKQARDSAVEQVNRQQKDFAQKLATVTKDKELPVAVPNVPSPKLPAAVPTVPHDTISFMQLASKAVKESSKSVELIRKLFDFSKSGVLYLLNFCHTTTALESHTKNTAKRAKLNPSPLVVHNNNNNNQEPNQSEEFLTPLSERLIGCLSSIANEENHPSHLFPVLQDFITYAMKDRKQPHIEVVENTLNLLETLLVNSDECRDLFSMCSCPECRQHHPMNKQGNLPERYLPLPQCPRILIRTKSGGITDNNSLAKKVENPSLPSKGVPGDFLLKHLINYFKDFVLSESIIEKLLRIFSITLTTISGNNLGNTFDIVDHQLKRFESLIQSGSIDMLLRHKDNMSLPATTVSLLFYLLTSPYLFELATKSNQHNKALAPLDRLSKLLLMKLASHQPLPFRHQIMHLLSFLVHHHRNGAALLLQCNEDLIMRVIFLLQQELDAVPPTEDPQMAQEEDQWKLIRESFNLLCDLVRCDSSGLFAGDKLTFLAVVKKLMKYSNCQPPLSDLAARAATLKSTFIESLNDMEADIK